MGKCAIKIFYRLSLYIFDVTFYLGQKNFHLIALGFSDYCIACFYLL